MVEWLMNNEQERIWKEVVTALLRYYPDITLTIDKDESGPREKITLLMNCLESWFRNNELILNIRKSCSLSFHPRQRIRVL
jgi:hypothetical protein